MTDRSFPNTKITGSDVRILLVDDYAPWRHYVLSLLAIRPELWDIFQAADGIEAVEMTKKLKPDLILLDIGLPKLNGMEAARQIRNVAPDSKILFLSQEASAAVVQTGMSLGAMGYVAKSRAGTKLFGAIEMALRGEQSISLDLADTNLDPSRRATQPSRADKSDELAQSKYERRSEPRAEVSERWGIRTPDVDHPIEICTTHNVSGCGLYFVTSSTHYFLGMKVCLFHDFDPRAPMPTEELGTIVRIDTLKGNLKGVAIQILAGE